MRCTSSRRAQDFVQAQAGGWIMTVSEQAPQKSGSTGTGKQVAEESDPILRPCATLQTDIFISPLTPLLWYLGIGIVSRERRQFVSIEKTDNPSSSFGKVRLCIHDHQIPTPRSSNDRLILTNRTTPSSTSIHRFETQRGSDFMEVSAEWIETLHIDRTTYARTHILQCLIYRRIVSILQEQEVPLLTSLFLFHSQCLPTTRLASRTSR